MALSLTVGCTFSELLLKTQDADAQTRWHEQAFGRMIVGHYVRRHADDPESGDHD